MVTLKVKGLTNNEKTVLLHSPKFKISIYMCFFFFYSVFFLFIR